MSDAETIDRPGTALVPVEKMTALQVFRPGGVDDVIARIKREVAAVEIDISTVTGRKACASLAYKIARSKTALDDMGKQLNEEHRAAINSVDAERRRIRSELEALAEQVRQPLTDYENAERERIAGNEKALAEIPEEPGYGTRETSAEIALRLNCLRAYPARDWREFSERAAKVLAAEIARTEALHAQAVTREAEAAELVRLRAEEAAKQHEEAARQQQEREERIAREAAEQARLEAEQRAEQELQAAAQRQAQTERQAQEAQERAAAAEQARRDAEAASERQRIAAGELAETLRLKALEQAHLDQEAAVAAERRRREQEDAVARAEADQRAADKAHRGKINREALQDLCGAANLTTDQAQAVVIAIASRKVRHVSVAY